MTDLLAISVLLAVCGGLLLWDHFGNAHRQVVALRLRAIHHRSSGDSLISAAALTAPFLLRLGNLESRFEILGWQYTDKRLGYVLVALIANFIVQSVLWGVIVSLISTLVLVFAGLAGIKALAKRKASKFIDEFPDFVDRIRQLVIAGNSITTAFDKAMRYCSATQLHFLNPVATMVAHGVPLYDALQQRASLLRVTELFLFTAIVRTNMRFGGDLSASLSHFETTLLNRLRAQKEFKAMTSELRMTTVILMALPLIAGVGIFLMNPHYLEFFMSTAHGRTAMIYVGGSVGLGLYLVKQLTKVEY